MVVVIVGASNLGASLAKLLLSGHEVTVIEKVPARSAELEESLGSVCVVGDGTDESTMSRAGVNRADVVIAATRQDDVNLAACQLARHRFGVGRTVSVINRSEYRELFEALGIDVPVDVSEMAANRLQESVTSDGLVQLLVLSSAVGTAVTAVRVPHGSRAAGLTLGESGLLPGNQPSLIVSSGGTAVVGDRSTVLQPGDEIITVAASGEIEDLRERLTQESDE